MATWIYELRIAGRVGDDVIAELSDELGSLLSTDECAGTVLVTSVADQAALLGMLDRLHGLGLSVREVRKLPEPADGSLIGASLPLNKQS